MIHVNPLHIKSKIWQRSLTFLKYCKVMRKNLEPSLFAALGLGKSESNGRLITQTEQCVGDIVVFNFHFTHAC